MYFMIEMEREVTLYFSHKFQLNYAYALNQFYKKNPPQILIQWA